MRSIVLFVAVGILFVSLSPLPASRVSAQVPIPELVYTIHGDTVDGTPTFVPSAIIIPQVPIVINLTFFNNQSVISNVPHTFTINDAAGDIALDTDANHSAFVLPQERRILSFTINSMTNITFEGLSFQPETYANGTIRFYCIPHAPGMQGAIILASAAQPVSLEKGINIRAYWIGMIGLLSMALWIGISYFIIKSSSPHFRDHREHVRRGLP